MSTSIITIMCAGEKPYELPIIEQFGPWAVHRCLEWHTGKSWATGELTPIALKTSPTRHNKACDDFLRKKIYQAQSDWEAKAIKRPTATDYDDQKQARDASLKKFTSPDICYGVSHIGAGLAWPVKYPLLTKTAAYNTAKILWYYLPEDLATIFVAKRKELPTELRNTLKGLLQGVPRPGEVNSEETRSFIRSELLRL